MRQHTTGKAKAWVAATKQSGWPLDVLVASGWILTAAGIAIVFDDNLALSTNGFGKTAVMSILVGVICWLSGGLERRTRLLGGQNAAKREGSCL